MSILKKIYEYKIDFVSNQKEITPQSKIESKLNINNNNFPFFEKLNYQKSQISIIGEIKKASPSLGKFTKENINLSYANGKVNGKKIAVPDAGVATHAVVVAKSDKGISIQLVDLSAKGVSVEHQENIDESRGHFAISFNDVETQLLGDEVSGWELYESLINQAAVLFSYEQIGGSQATLDMAINYAKERYAFGRPIGSYQAIKHKLADMYIALTLAKSNCYYAAWALSTDAADLPSASATARVSATKAYQLCSKENIQTHGGNGFTWEYDCHMFYRRSKLLSLNIGSLSNWREKLVTSLEQSNIN